MAVCKEHKEHEKLTVGELIYNIREKVARRIVMHQLVETEKNNRIAHQVEENVQEYPILEQVQLRQPLQGERTQLLVGLVIHYSLFVREIQLGCVLYCLGLLRADVQQETYHREQHGDPDRYSDYRYRCVSHRTYLVAALEIVQNIHHEHNHWDVDKNVH